MHGRRPEIERIWTEAAADAGVDAAWELRLAGQTLAANDPERLFPGASMVKTLLAALLDEDVRTRGVELSRSVQVTRAALVGDDGLLRYGQIPTMHRLADLILLMVAVSDNTATNTLVGFLGGPGPVNQRFAARRWESRVHALVGEPHPAGFSSVSIADHQSALAEIAHPLIRATFAAQQDRRALARHLDFSAEFSHKTGTAGGVRHDAGVLHTPRGPLWVACFTDGGPEAEYVDHPACRAMGSAMADTLRTLGLGALTVAG